MLSISNETVKTHVKRIFMKLDIHDRALAIVAAYESGLVKPGTDGQRVGGTVPGSRRGLGETAVRERATRSAHRLRSSRPSPDELEDEQRDQHDHRDRDHRADTGMVERDQHHETEPDDGDPQAAQVRGDERRDRALRFVARPPGGRARACVRG